MYEKLKIITYKENNISEGNIMNAIRNYKMYD